MALKLSEQQIELRDSIRRFFDDQCPLSYVRKRFLGEAHHDLPFISKSNELGLNDYFAEIDGGGSIRDLALFAFECGRALVPESLTDYIFSGPLLFSKLVQPTFRSQLAQHLGNDTIAEIISGKRLVAIAPSSGFSHETLSFRGRGNSQRVTGPIRLVAGADIVDFLLFCTRGELKLCDLKTGKEQQVKYLYENTLDRTERKFNIDLANVHALTVEGVGSRAIEHLYSILKANELAGIAGKAVEMTVEYVKTRKQFDQPIGTFQAVQHKLADMHLQAEATRTLSDFAAWAADESPDQVALSASAAIIHACENVPQIVENAIQLHGGIGFTYEYDLHFYLRRAKTLQAIFGPSSNQSTDSKDSYQELIDLAS